MAAIRIPKFHRSAHTAQPIADANTSVDADEHESGPTAASMSYVWLCTIVGAALSVGIGAGVGLDHAGVTAGTASWVAGVVAFWMALLLLMTSWLVTHR
jgi:hypothetical protein